MKIIEEKDIKKPSRPHIMESQIELTEEEFEKRMLIEERLSELGISTSIFDARKDGYEDPDILKAIILVNKGEEIPEDLKRKLQNKNISKSRKGKKK